MSRVENIVTGERMMTEGNALRHYLAKGKKTIKSNDYERMKTIWNEATKVIDCSSCYKCPQDDIGYCGLRYSDVSEEQKFVKYCFPSVLEWWEYQLSERQR